MALSKVEKELMMERNIKEISEYLKDGQKVYTILRRVSRNGTGRVISLVTVEDNKIFHLSRLASSILEYPLKEANGSYGLFVKGCGMDMGYHLVSQLKRVLNIDLDHSWL